MSATAAALATQPSQNLLQPWSQQQLNDNANASALLRSPAYGKRFRQQIYNATFTPTFGNPTVITVPISNVGLITKFVVVCSTTVTNPAGGSLLTRGSFGPFSTYSLITYTDPNSNTRINTTGAHLGAVTARRHRRVPGAALTTNSPSGFGSVLSPVSAPSTIAANAGTGTVNCVYEVPLAVGRNSTKGAVFAGAVFATQSLQLTFNPNFASSGADPFGVVYTGSNTGANAPTFSHTVTVYQEVLGSVPAAIAVRDVAGPEHDLRAQNDGLFVADREQ